IPGMVGYKIRFHDHTTAENRIKFMTDGVLLAETGADPLLQRYDTIIIDEAHERSLNIDFLLGYLKQLLTKRKELKLIIASATIDTEKFSNHFNKAPIIEVSGRTYPVEIRYTQTVSENDEEAESYVDAAVRRVIALTEETAGGDMLVFMPTERDIRDAVAALEETLPQTLILPLFGRLQTADQRRIFLPAKQRKIIVATNVAETSITVPGIRYVVDTGLARLSRYNIRAGATSLPVSRISRASCDQRAGRCGRTGPGICIRLYSEEDYLSRPDFTPPEIQRSNLAEVILRMISLRLGDPRKFPFLDPPSGRTISDGFRTLRELGGISGNDSLTHHGRIMADLPLDPRMTKIIIEAAELGALREIKIIVSALSIMDPRIRPADREEKADAAHQRFQESTSDFLSFLKIWETYHTAAVKVRSAAQLRKFCTTHFLSWQRMREWFDIHEQITELLTRHKGFMENTAPASPQTIHQALTYGFLRNIGLKKEKNLYQVAGGREVMLFPGSALFNKGGQWIVAASFIETSRLFARTTANIEVEWLERIGGELCRKHWSEPHWEQKSGRVVAFERVSLFGLTIVAGRRVDYGSINEKTMLEAREIFIRSALIGEELGGNYRFLNKNSLLIKHLHDMEQRLRRRGILEEEHILYDFYDQRLGNVYSRFTLNRFIKKKRGDHLLIMEEEDIRASIPDQEELYRFPKTLSIPSGDIGLIYRFEPGHEKDGVTAQIPVTVVQGINPTIFEWLVPGLLRDKILHLLKGLPKNIRKQLVPLPNTVDLIFDTLDLYKGSLYPALEKALLKLRQVGIRRGDWQMDNLPPHLRMRFELRSEQGTIICASRSFEEITKRAHYPVVSVIPSSVGPELKEKGNIVDWDFEGLTSPIPVCNKLGLVITCYFPTLFIDRANNCLQLRCIEEKNKSESLNRQGLLFLYSLKFSKEKKILAAECKNSLARNSASWLSLGSGVGSGELMERLVNFIIATVLALESFTLPDLKQYNQTVSRITETGLSRAGKKILSTILDLLTARRQTVSAMANWAERAKKCKNYSEEKYREYQERLEDIAPADFLLNKSYEEIEHCARHLKALELRITRAEQSEAKDVKKNLRIEPFAKKLKLLSPSTNRTGPCRRAIAQYKLMVEEFRVSVFAPELGTVIPVSEKKLQQQWEELEDTCRSIE
ncbi:MAG: ATP-dependent RNA helicase HrpA, partial [Desulfobulbaceae bacterium]|nr:ATP-dependent RNA helicase HrpA [Desulfobulbaceae bacterium]